MIATHDSLTYLRPRLAIMSLFTPLWRTQTKEISAQIKAGARYLDIRVRKRGDKWQACHGLVDLKMQFSTIAEIAETFKDVNIRIVLERGDNTDRQEFITRSAYVTTHYPNVRHICIKKPWQTVWSAGSPNIVDMSYVPWNTGKTFWQNIRDFRFSTIASWARTHNPLLSEEMKASTLTAYFIDRL